MMNIDKKAGVLIGRFEPLHQGHIRSILNVANQVKVLHIFITPHPRPNPKYTITLEDKARWIKRACKDLPFIQVHILEGIELPINTTQTFENDQVDILVSSSKLIYAIEKAGLDISLPKNSPESPVLFVDENHPLYKPEVRSYLPLKVQSVPVYTEFDSYAIHQNPVEYWHIIHPEARGDYTKTIAIVGGKKSGKTTLVHKLAHYYEADMVLKMGRNDAQYDLGGMGASVQYSDYASIALSHAHALREATYQAKAPVTLVDIDFVSMQAYCEEYVGQPHPFLTACIEEFRIDHTIMLEDSEPWITDGIKFLHDDDSSNHFEKRLVELFTHHKITPHCINRDDYYRRFSAVVEYIDKAVYGLDNG